LSDRYGARFIVGCGLFLSAFANVAMGASFSLTLMLVLACVNGGAQATGWSGLVKTMSAWFPPRDRGVVMAWWSTNYVLGGFLATLIATYAVTQNWLWGAFVWQRGLWIPALLLLPIALLFVVGMRNGPIRGAAAGAVSRERAPLREVLRNRVVWTIAISYFFVKATRYAFIFWLPLYFSERLRYAPGKAGAASSVYELVGFTGVVLAGYVSDRLLRSRRFPVAAVMLWAMGLLCLLQPMTASLGALANMAGIGLIGLIGMLTFGPDTLMSGPAVQDAVSTRAAATAAGFVNGVGSLGQLCSPYLVAVVADRFGWDSLFYLFFLFALLSGLLLSLLWTHQPRMEPCLTESA
jgi:OPA family sugar phosphate sensor protein UhpC-like MFS transporter